MRTRNPQRLLAYALIVIGVVMLVSRIGGADWLWLALISALLLFGYVSRKSYNFLVAGGVLMGIAVGTLIGTDSGMLLSLAAGFLAIDRVEPKPNRWALYSAGIFAVLGALVAFGSFGLLGSTAFALALVAAGVYLLYREGDKHTARASTSTSSYPAPQDASTETPAAAAPATPYTSPTPSEPHGVPPNAATATPTHTAYTSKDSSPETSAPVSSAPPTEPSQQPEQPVLSDEAKMRLRQLEAWRRETAAADGVPPYIIFSNDTLAKLAAANPQTLDELATIRGVGPVKLSRYGETVLGVVRAAPKSTAS